MLSLKVLYIFGFLVIIATGISGRLVGGATQLQGEDLKEAEDILKNSLQKIAAGEGPNYTISNVQSATRQVVSGTLYKYKVDLKDENNKIKNCNVSIWQQPWLENGTEVTIECAGEPKVVRRHG